MLPILNSPACMCQSLEGPTNTTDKSTESTPVGVSTTASTVVTLPGCQTPNTDHQAICQLSVWYLQNSDFKLQYHIGTFFTIGQQIPFPLSVTFATINIVITTLVIPQVTLVIGRLRMCRDVNCCPAPTTTGGVLPLIECATSQDSLLSRFLYYKRIEYISEQINAGPKY
ncbi:uncharacterized protein LACBIDRAFT_330557 [Laccaria bicolor S238N-H82]|uniref:Predicted protein n=1 Tax=Laccaria bicolor (strain S238N-H82 / ATCC MYA-4686) TaxID=486041 RepID=B0DLP7_LACBS|nr:uncharacterized protein LACBIDRAFT_330557 [Laccaria bicolor S238N-H82]EDR04334.1 predicted protein [Laccaria bicolor S238N-H82]|eukprot:XP_001884853.1 predicted protein [Laccaria bicolor S238N-H82]